MIKTQDGSNKYSPILLQKTEHVTVGGKMARTLYVPYKYVKENAKLQKSKKKSKFLCSSFTLINTKMLSH